jgi:two-component system response regulator
LVLLDLNMPRKSGRETLAELKADPLLRRLPVVVLSTGADPMEVNRSYELGAASYVAKPATYEGLILLVRALRTWWSETVTLPEAR